jgi:predicted ATP-grasp superfamily ATP-dependent carboligase
MELVERARDISMFQLHSDACVKGKLPAFDLSAAPAKAGKHGKAVVFAREDIVVGDTRGWLDDPSVRDVPHESEHILAGHPMCTVLVTGSDEQHCYANLVARAARVYNLFA